MQKFLLSIAALAVLALAPFAAEAQTISKSQTGAVGTVLTCTDTSGASVRCVVPTVTLADSTGAQIATAARPTAGADDVSNTLTGEQVYSRTSIYDGATWDRWVSVQGGGSTAGAGVGAVSMFSHSSGNGTINNMVSTAVESGRVVKAGAGNLYGIAATSGASAGYLMVFNATSVPADGAVTPHLCRVIAANSSITVDYGPIATRYSVGISAAFSTTGCFTKTASATAMFEVRYQ